MTKRVVDGARTSPTRREGRDGRVEVRALRLPSVFLALVLAGPACAQAPVAQASPLDSYAEAAATTIIAEQSCPGVQVKAGQLTTLRLGARVNAGQEAVLQEKLRTRASQVRQQLAADGREAWCAGALAAFGPQGSIAKGILVTGAPIR